MAISLNFRQKGKKKSEKTRKGTKKRLQKRKRENRDRVPARALPEVEVKGHVGQAGQAAAQGLVLTVRVFSLSIFNLKKQLISVLK